MALNEKLVSKIAISTCAAAMLTLTGCSSSDDDTSTVSPVTTSPALTYPTTLQGEITSDMTLTMADSPVLLAGNKIKVKNGATLTIEPGVRLCGESQAYLVITKGAKLMAEGTEAAPIEFTSQAACEGAPAAAGQWGGVTLLGNAITNEADDIRYEVDESDADFAYGGTDDADNSGVLKHVKILNSGYAVAVDKEVNGLSLCGIGSGTVVDNITIVDSGDDGIEIWGGSVELNHISITGAQDDGFDVDSGYHGAVTDLTVTQTEPGAALIEMTNGGDASKQRTDWSLDGFTLTASVNQKKEGGLYFKDLDVTGTFKNGTIDMTASPAINTGAGLTNKEGVHMSPVFENVTVKGSESVDLQANRRDGDTTDAGTIELYGAFASGTANSYVNYTPQIAAYSGELRGEITEDTRLTLTNSPYKLAGNAVKVKNGATLYIDAGVTIYGESQAYLVITKGSKIMANGTATAPIIFTSEAVLIGGAPAAAGQWGGVTLLGNAITNEADDIRYEVDESDADFAYGGDDDADNSGVLNYVKILNSGYAVAVDKEVNGLSLCGVGSGTVVDNITVVDSGDDGIEIWGGSVELNHISITGAQDDGFDVDSGYHGAVTDLTVIQTEPGAALIEMTNGGDASKQRTDWSLDGFTLTASVNQKKEGGLYFKDLDVTGTFKNGTIDMSESPLLNTAAGLTHKEGVFASPVFENITVKGSASVDVQANNKGGDATDAGATELNNAMTTGTANSYISYPVF